MSYPTRKKRKGHPKLRFFGRLLAVLSVVCLSVALLLVGAVWLICKGPSVTARDLFVTSVQEHETWKFLPSLFLSDEEIDTILAANRLVAPDKITDTTVDFVESDTPASKPIEKIDLKNDTYTGTLLVIHDPLRLELACVSTFGTNEPGASVETFAEQTKAVAAIGCGIGSTPNGFVIQNGELIHGDKVTAASVVAFDEAGRLIVGTMTAEQAISAGVRNAVCSKTAAIVVNGVASEIVGLGDGLLPRAVIGQRADGAVLMMVLDGAKETAPGVLLENCIHEMLKAGAINAAVLDSTDSAALLYQNELQNDAPDAQDRRVPTAYVVL